jgi:hypothetical protein
MARSRGFRAVVAALLVLALVPAAAFADEARLPPLGHLSVRLADLWQTLGRAVAALGGDMDPNGLQPGGGPPGELGGTMDPNGQELPPGNTTELGSDMDPNG